MGKMENQSIPSKRRIPPLAANLQRNWTLYTMVLPGVAIFIVFSYIPIYGIVMAFQEFKPVLGFFKSPFADPWYRYFKLMFTDAYFMRILKNTLILGVYNLLFSFPAPIILALLLNEIQHEKYKKVIQTISYMPYFLSVVIVVGILKLLFATKGPINIVLDKLGLRFINIFMAPQAFRTLYITSGIWTGIGMGSIIYLAAISGINPELYESAVIDGADRLRQTIHITLPSMLPTIIVLFILSVPSIIGNDYGKILLIYNPATYSTADVIGTYVYRSGIEGSSRSYAAAVGLFTSVFGFFILVIANTIARRLGETSLW